MRAFFEHAEVDVVGGGPHIPRKRCAFIYSRLPIFMEKQRVVKKNLTGEKTPVITADGFVPVSFGLTRTEPVFAHVSHRRVIIVVVVVVVCEHANIQCAYRVGPDG